MRRRLSELDRGEAEQGDQVLELGADGVFPHGAPGAGPGESVAVGGLFGYGTVVAPACPGGSAGFARHGGHIPAPIHSLSN